MTFLIGDRTTEVNTIYMMDIIWLLYPWKHLGNSTEGTIKSL